MEQTSAKRTYERPAMEVVPLSSQPLLACSHDEYGFKQGGRYHIFVQYNCDISDYSDGTATISIFDGTRLIHEVTVGDGPEGEEGIVEVVCERPQWVLKDRDKVVNYVLDEIVSDGAQIRCEGWDYNTNEVYQSCFLDGCAEG